MNLGARLTATALLLALVPCAPASAQRPGEVPDPRLMRARILSSDTAGDASSLTLPDRALLWARLGEVWWEDDEERARSFISKAVEGVESESELETPKERGRRLAAARALLPLVAPREPELAERLSALLT